MEQQQQQQQINVQPGMEAHLPSELSGKFRCKADFMKYFKEQLQLYVPPEICVNHDFLKQVLTNEKALFSMQEIKWVNVPLYDELSVKNLYDDMIQYPEFRRYFPDKLPKGRQMDRSYFFNIMMTLNPDYTGNLILHAERQRHSADSVKNAQQNIQVTPEWWANLQAQPFISRKYLKVSNFLQNARVILSISLNQSLKQFLSRDNESKSLYSRPSKSLGWEKSTSTKSLKISLTTRKSSKT